jgi:hypothetical protein
MARGRAEPLTGLARTDRKTSGRFGREETMALNVPEESFATGGVKDEARFERLLDDVESYGEGLRHALSLAYWDKLLGSEPPEYKKLKDQAARLARDRGLFEVVRKWLPRLEAGTTLERRAVLHDRHWSSGQVAGDTSVYKLQDAVTDAILGFRYDVDGREMTLSDVRHILRKSDDRAMRERAYRSPVRLSQTIEGDLRDLMQRRNSKAQEMGAETYVDFTLSLYPLAKSEVLGYFARFEELTRPVLSAANERWRAELGVPELRGWDQPYCIDREAGLPQEHFPKDRILEATVKAARSLGFDVGPDSIKAVFAPLPYGGICCGIKPPGDIRILMDPKDGYEHYQTMFHEYGHGLHGRYSHDHPHEIFKGGGPGCFSEAMAVLMTDLLESGECWLRSESGLPDSVIDDYTDKKAAKKVLGLRRTMQLSEFEFRAYEDLGQDLDALWRETSAKYTLLDPEATPGWTCETLYTTHPVYYQNYALAEMISAQIADFIESRWDKVLGNREIAEYWIESYLAPGATIEFTEKIEKGTGKRLGPDALSERLGA